MLRLLLVFIFILGFSLAQAQSLSVVSHYPASAYVSKRLLPFTIVGETEIQILSVNFQNGDSCKGMGDPFHKNIFHVFCSEAEVFSTSVVLINEAGELVTLDVDSIAVAVQRAPETAGGEASTGGE